MALTPAQTESFGGGLNLRDKADAVSDADAIDLLNIEFTDRGSIRQRAGYAEFTTSPLTAAPQSLEPLYTTAGISQLVAGCGTRLEALDTDGTVAASQTGLTTGIWDFCRYGGPGREVVYAGQGSQTLRKWDGSAWSAVANTPMAGALAVMSVEQGNRMVAGRFHGTTGGPTGAADTSNPSRVYFSDPADPETWGSANWLDFTPGDGEKIQAIHAWESFVFVFKETKFFRITGASTSASGTPIFQWDTFDAGAGLASPRAVASDETGVYFMGRDGLFRTTGGDAEHLSGIVEPIFYGGASPYYLGGVLEHSAIESCVMTVHEDRVYLGFPVTASENDRTLVYDTHGDWWSLYDFPATCLSTFRIGSRAELIFGRPGDNHLLRHNLSYTDDAGDAIAAHWRSGWHAFGTPEQKVVRESKVWGAGRCLMGVSVDYEPDPGTLLEIDFGTEATGDDWSGTTWGGGHWSDGTILALRPKFRNRSEGGTVFSTYFRNRVLEQSFELSRLSHHLREQRIPSVA